MMIRPFVAALVLCICCSVAPAQPVSVIFDTDIMGDVDDVGAVAVLHALAAKGEAKILAMGVSAKHPACVPALSVLNDYYGRPDIPVGVVKGHGFLRDTRYADKLAAEFPHSITSADDVPEAALLYREVLAKQPANSVVMISVGQLTNFRNLLFSGPDKHSPLTGLELVKRKVKFWSCMGAKIPSGREANLVHDGPAAQQAIDYWPTPIVFSPWEVGIAVQAGGRLGELPESSPVRRAYELFKDGIKPHNSFDHTSVQYAIQGAGELWSVESAGHLHVELDGSNEWRKAPNKTHSYLKLRTTAEEVAGVIEDLMLYQPGG
jgi:inosine-uridine preferring nucleoside hydrolase